MSLISVDSTLFRVVYDARDAFPNALLGAFFGLVFVGIGLLILRQSSVLSRFGASPDRARLFGIGAIFVGGAGTVLVVATTVIPDIGLRIALGRGKYQVRDGIVAAFVPGDAGDHRSESWTLRTSAGDFSYSYSPSILEPGYNQTAAHGGEIRNGIRVRVWDVAGHIAHLEVSP